MFRRLTVKHERQADFSLLPDCLQHLPHLDVHALPSMRDLHPLTTQQLGLWLKWLAALPASNPHVVKVRQLLLQTLSLRH